MTEVDEDVYVPPMPEHITLAINCSLDEPTKPFATSENYAGNACTPFHLIITIIHLFLQKLEEWLAENNHS